MDIPRVGLPPELLTALFPFHLAFDRNMEIKQAGDALLRTCPRISTEKQIPQNFRIKRPNVPIEFDAIREKSRSMFLLDSLHDELQFKGQMVYIDQPEVMLFLCFPWVTDLTTLRELGLDINDFPIHNPMVEFLFLLQAQDTAFADAHKLTNKLELRKGAQEYLTRFVPESVKRVLKENPQAPELEKTDQDMSAMFLDVTGYTKLSEEMRQTADFVVEKYFSRFLDSIHANEGDLTQTSGDGLMVVFPDEDPNRHPIKAVNSALDILAKTADLNEQLKGIFEPISVHIGINSGVALIGPTKFEGASGTRWTYTALGPMINLAARIAGIAEGGTILVGPETARRIAAQFPTREIGKRRLKNVKNELMLYKVERQ